MSIIQNIFRKKGNKVNQTSKVVESKAEPTQPNKLQVTNILEANNQIDDLQKQLELYKQSESEMESEMNKLEETLSKAATPTKQPLAQAKVATPAMEQPTLPKKTMLQAQLEVQQTVEEFRQFNIEQEAKYKEATRAAKEASNKVELPETKNQWMKKEKNISKETPYHFPKLGYYLLYDNNKCYFLQIYKNPCIQNPYPVILIKQAKGNHGTTPDRTIYHNMGIQTIEHLTRSEFDSIIKGNVSVNELLTALFLLCSK